MSRLARSSYANLEHQPDVRETSITSLSQAKPATSDTHRPIRHHWLDLDGSSISYREADPQDAPAMLLFLPPKGRTVSRGLNDR